MGETYVDVLPRLAKIGVETDPPGLQVTLDGKVETSPLAVTGVVGITRTLGVVSPQSLGTDLYAFVSWSDGGAATHDITTPAADTTWTAMFREDRAGGRDRPDGHLLQRTGAQRDDLRAHRPDHQLQLGNGLAGARDRRGPLEREVDGAGGGRGERTAHLLRAQRRRPALGERNACWWTAGRSTRRGWTRGRSP